MEVRHKGIVNWFGSKGQSWGYIYKDGGGEIYVHYKNIISTPTKPNGLLFLERGQRVAFDIAGGHYRDGTQAINVEVLENE